jgi:hypothetical protein
MTREEPKPIEKRSRVFRHGTIVRYKNGPKGKGVITSYPRRGSRSAFVKGPHGWAGWACLDTLEIVLPSLRLLASVDGLVHSEWAFNDNTNYGIALCGREYKTMEECIENVEYMDCVVHVPPTCILCVVRA